MTEYKCCTTSIAFGNVLVELQAKTGRNWLGSIMQNPLSA